MVGVVLCCATVATPAGVQAQSSLLTPPAVIAVSPRTFLRNSPATIVQVIATEPLWPIPTSTVNEVLWNGAPLSTSLSSGVYQAMVPASLLTVSQPITISMRKRNTLTGEVGLPGPAQSAIVTDTISAPALSPAIEMVAGEWQVNLWIATLPLDITVRDRYGLPLIAAPVLINTDYGVFGSGSDGSPQRSLIYTDWSGRAHSTLYIETSRLTQTITPTIHVTASTIFVGEFATTALSSTVVIRRATTFLPLLLERFPPANHDFCSPWSLSPAQAVSRPPNASMDVYQPFWYTLPPPNEPVITMSRGVQIKNYSAVGRLELYSVQQNQCYAGGTVTATLLASAPIPPRNQQPFQWCPPEARLKVGDIALLMVVRNDADRSMNNYTIAANFQVTPTQSGLAFCDP